MAGEPSNNVYSMFAFIGFILVSVPFYWHLEAWNAGTCLYMAWAGLGCLINFINSVVWNDNVLNIAPVWCDISTRLTVGLSVGIPAASLCMNRRLYHIATLQSVTSTKAEKHRAVFIDLAIGVGIPVLQMILELIVQGHRFDILEEIGCLPTVYNTPPAYPLVVAWPIAISLVSAIYCGLTIRTLAKRRSEFNEMLSGCNNLNSSRYNRLMGLTGVELCLGLPWSIYMLYFNIESGILPWISWANVHYDFGQVDQFPAFQWKQDATLAMLLESSRWSPIICSFIFFAFFGFAQEARKNYRLAFNFVSKKVGYDTSRFNSSELSSSFGGSKQPKTTALGSLPIYIHQKTTSKRDTCVSFSTNITLGDVGGTLDDVIAPYSSTDSGSSHNALDEKPESLLYPPALTPPAPTLDVHSPPHHFVDTPRPHSSIV